jgi:peptidoglycan hydrolase-like protein with peptidoglycan-binding domain
MPVPKWWTRPLVSGERGRDVDVVQRKLGTSGGVYDDATQAHVRGFQVACGLVVDGIVGPVTAGALGEAADHALTPEWYVRPLEVGSQGEDVAALQVSLGLDPSAYFDELTRRAVLRFQSANNMKLTGAVNRAFALALP